MDKKVIEDKKQLVLLVFNELQSQGINKFEDINLDLYKKIILSYYVAHSFKIFLKIFNLDVPTEYFRIKKYITIDRKNKLLQLYYNGDNQYSFDYYKPINTEYFEKIVIISRLRLDSIYNYRQKKNYVSIKQYAEKFPNLKYLIINISDSNNLTKDCIQMRIEFIQIFKFIENVDILLNDVQIIKRKENIQVEQSIQSQKYFKIELKKENNIQLVQKLNKVIDLTNNDNIQLIQKLIEESVSPPNSKSKNRQIKLFLNNNSINQAQKALEKFPNINSVYIILLKEDDTDIDAIKHFILSLQKLKKIIFQDKQETNFIQKHHKLINICQQKFNDIEVTWFHSQSKMIIYGKNSKYLRIVYSIYNQTLLITEDEFKLIFSLYPEVEKVSILAHQDSIQNAINALNLLKNLKKLKIKSQYKDDYLDFSPIYLMNLQKIKFCLIESFGSETKEFIIKSIESLLNHPTCPIISSNEFKFNSKLKYVYLEIKWLQYSKLFINLILNKYNDTQNIEVKVLNQINWQYFFSKVLTAPSLLRIDQVKYERNQQTKQLYLIFIEIKIQRLQIKAIQNLIAEFIPIYLPSLIYDLYN